MIICEKCGKLYDDSWKNCPHCFATNENYKPKPTKVYTPHCPICGSPDIKKITFGSRAVSVAAVGIFSKKINKSYICNNCKATF